MFNGKSKQAQTRQKKASQSQTMMRNQIPLEQRDWIAEICKESAIHGMPYLARRDLHWSERLFWCLTIIGATYYSLNICLNQWERFRNNPIVYGLDLTFDRTDFPYAGITLCSDSQKEIDTNALIYDTWGIKTEENKEAAVYYQSFLSILNTLRFDTMHKLLPYENDTSLENINFMETLLALQNHFLPLQQAESTELESVSVKTGYGKDIYAAAITEAGLCRTTSQLSRYTNPYGKIKSLQVKKVDFCDFLSECVVKLLPTVNSTTRLTLHLHNVYDIVTPNDRSTIIGIMEPETSLTMELLLQSTSAESDVYHLPIAYRKCRYQKENNLKYFQSYRPSLCRIECRINAALTLCRCKPYFYAVGPRTPICNIKGMLCLVRKNWTSANCQCFPLCEEITYINLQGVSQADGSAKFERTIVIKLSLPKMEMKRRVIFSTDQLIMSFGGAIGLLLGASFMTLFGLFYVFLEYICPKTKHACQKRKRRTRIDIVKNI